MTLNKNPGGITWTLSSRWWCGINKAFETDPTCSTAAGAAPSDQPMSVNTNVYKPWGTGTSTNSITTYPLVAATTQFYSSTGNPKVTANFRGWDTLSRSSTTMLDEDSDG